METMEAAKTPARKLEVARLTPRQELAILLRVLFTEGFDDHVFGHITVAQDGGTYLTNPNELPWDQVRASDILVVDDTIRKLEGEGTPHSGLALHFAVRRHAQGIVRVVIHNHPRYATLYAAARRVPPVYDQGGAMEVRDLPLIEDYGSNAEIGRSHGAAIARAGWALLAHHGVVITADSFAQACFRATALETRAKRAWEVEAIHSAGPMSAGPMAPELVRKAGAQVLPEYADYWWDFMKRRTLNIDRTVLD